MPSTWTEALDSSRKRRRYLNTMKTKLPRKYRAELLAALRNTLAAYIAAKSDQGDYLGSSWLTRVGNSDPVVIEARRLIALAEPDSPR